MNKDIKKKLFGRPQTILIKPPAGLVSFCESEVRNLIATTLQPLKFEPQIEEMAGDIWVKNIDFRLAIEIMLRTRTARDLRLVIGDQHVGSFGEFAKLLEKVPWDFFTTPQNTFAVQVESVGSKLYHEGKLKELVANHLQTLNTRVSDDGLPLYIFQTKNRCQVLLSLAGKPLYQRGFKQHLHTTAPLAENLAAALIDHILPGREWDEVLVPFAGSGTLAFETLMASGKLAPAMLRKGYALEEMSCFPEQSFRFLTDKLSLIPASDLGFTLVEKDDEQFKELKSNIHNFSIGYPQGRDWDLILGDIFDFALERFKGKKVFLPLNPPYGLRLRQQDTVAFYVKLARLVDSLASQCDSLGGFCLVAHEQAYKSTRAVLADIYRETVHFNQGGIHVRAIYFRTD